MSRLTWNKLLQPKRFRDKTSVSRESSDNRSPFKKDFDTVCNSTILRRLQDKAQVFPLEQEDYARTRLTHSIEVMSIAESLGVLAITVIHDKEHIEPEQKDLLLQINEIPNILKTAALLHDMGNPPFGHLGEKIIGDWFQNNLSRLSFNSENKLVYNTSGETKHTLEYILKGSHAEDLKHFEGNAQLFRLVNRLSLVVDEHGMNLTFPVMSTFIKYPTSSCNIDKSKLKTKKMGYFTSEKELFKEIDSTLELNHCRHPLAFLLEAADDIAYLTADIEDAHRKGLISIDQLQEYLRKESKDSKISEILNAIEQYKSDAIKMEYEDVEDYVIHRLRILVKGMMIASMSDAFSQSYDQIMNGTFDKELMQVSSVCRVSKILRQIERDNIYYCSSILKTKIRALAVITKLLETYIPAIVNWEKSTDSGTDSSSNLLYMSMSTNYRYICNLANKELENSASPLSDEAFESMIYNKILLVTDQISGMTDTHALSIFKMLTAN